MKKLLYLVIALAVIFGVIYITKTKKVDVVVVSPIDTTSKPIQLCFYNETKTSRGLYDVNLLKMNLDGSKVTGEFRYVPAEKDSKTGTFEGTVGPVDKIAMARTADLWWDSMAEGMQVKEQLKITFGEGTAQAGFGEMVDRGDGVYVYKDASKLTYGVAMSDVSCSDVDDRMIVEKYIRENIKTLAPEKTVLGGSWYLTTLHIVPNLKTGEMTYEDGHIQGKASFSYVRDGNNVTINNVQKSK
jgi:hypothetical protein